MKKSLLLAIILVLTSSSICFAKVVKQYQNGKLYSVQVYEPDGIPKGPYRVYWPNGRLKSKTLYTYGRPYRTQTWSIDGVRLQ